MTVKYPLLLLLAFTVFTIGCSKQDLEEPVSSNMEEISPEIAEIYAGLIFRTPGEPICTDATRFDFHTLSGNPVNGGARAANGETVEYVNFYMRGDWRIEATRIYVGDCDAIPTNPDGTPDVDAFPYQSDHTPPVRSKTFVIPLADVDDCSCVVAYADVVLLDGQGGILQSESGYAGDTPFGTTDAYFDIYCAESCLPCEVGHRTQTPGGWGANPNGNNPGVYLHNNFAGAFPAGLTIGCDQTLTLSSAQAVTDFLPSGGSPAALDQDYVDPVVALGTLAGHAVALKLSVVFDAYDNAFSVSDYPLDDLVLASGAFEGWSVGQVLAEAELILGGCDSNYTPSEITDALTLINENFVDGTVDNGNVICE